MKVRSVGSFMVEYGNDDVDGEIQLAKLLEQFDVIVDPSEHADIEFLLKAKIEAGEAETGLYDLGTSYVVVDRVGSEVTFQWFSHMLQFNDVLLND